jgi:hypothetical protein
MTRERVPGHVPGPGPGTRRSDKIDRANETEEESRQMPVEPGKIRNVAVVGHRSTGKTSLVEAMLFQAGAINRLGTIEAGTTTGDWDDDEHAGAVPERDQLGSERVRGKRPDGVGSGAGHGKHYAVIVVRQLGPERQAAIADDRGGLPRLHDLGVDPGPAQEGAPKAGCDGPAAAVRAPRRRPLGARSAGPGADLGFHGWELRPDPAAGGDVPGNRSPDDRGRRSA